MNVRELIAQAVGEGSMCWKPLPSTQVFDPDRAVKIVDNVVEKLTQALEKNAKSHMQYCKKCNKAHVPRCDKCGKSVHDGADLRSYHGPCGKCAFPNGVKVAAFVDELQKISGCGNYERVHMTDDQEALDNIRINAHFFHKDNDRMHPAHRRLFKMVEQAADAQLQADGLEKGAGMLHNVGTRIVARAQSIGPWAMRQAAETGEALVDHLSPIQKMRESWNASHWWGMKGLTVGGAALAVPEVTSKEDPLRLNRGRAERLIGNVAGTASGLVTMKRGLVPALATGLAAQYAGGRVGRLIDKARAKKAPKTPQTPAAPALVQPAATTPERTL